LFTGTGLIVMKKSSLREGEDLAGGKIGRRNIEHKNNNEGGKTAPWGQGSPSGRRRVEWEKKGIVGRATTDLRVREKKPMKHI